MKAFFQTIRETVSMRTVAAAIVPIILFAFIWGTVNSITWAVQQHPMASILRADAAPSQAWLAANIDAASRYLYLTIAAQIIMLLLMFLYIVFGQVLMWGILVHGRLTFQAFWVTMLSTVMALLIFIPLGVLLYIIEKGLYVVMASAGSVFLTILLLFVSILVFYAYLLPLVLFSLHTYLKGNVRLALPTILEPRSYLRGIVPFFVAVIVGIVMLLIATSASKLFDSTPLINSWLYVWGTLGFVLPIAWFCAAIVRLEMALQMRSLVDKKGKHR